MRNIFKFLIVAVLALGIESKAQALPATLTELADCKWPACSPEAIPVYLSNTANWFMQNGVNTNDNLGIVNEVLGYLRRSGSKYRYYYAGLTSSETCTSTYAVITYGDVHTNCGNGRFAAGNRAYTVYNASLSTGFYLQFPWGIYRNIIWALSGVNIDMTSGVYHYPTETEVFSDVMAMQYVQGGVSVWPIVRKPFTSGTWQSPATHGTAGRTLGFSNFSCINNPQTSSTDCLDIDTVGNLRFTRTNRASPTEMQFECVSTNAPNCWEILKLQTQPVVWFFGYLYGTVNDYTFNALDPWPARTVLPPVLVRDPVRNKLWAFWSSHVFTSGDNGQHWTDRGTILDGSNNYSVLFAASAAYDPGSDRIVVVAAKSFNGADLDNKIHIASIPAGVTAPNMACGNIFYSKTCGGSYPPPAPTETGAGPMTMSQWTVFNSLTPLSRSGTMSGDLTYMAGANSTVSLSCGGKRTTANGDRRTCSLLYNDGSRERVTREMVFVPYEGTYPLQFAWVLSTNPIDSAWNWTYGFAAAQTNNVDTNTFYVVNDQSDLWSNNRPSGWTSYWGWASVDLNLPWPKAFFGLSYLDNGDGTKDLMYRGGVVDTGCRGVGGIYYPPGDYHCNF